ncbi:MAG: hypothetical protein HOO67_07795 [Candidatus Peribacteraceae bacterium]|nr:hypothetical protein [Candidatus Peribacteraceae bacterium]
MPVRMPFQRRLVSALAILAMTLMAWPLPAVAQDAPPPTLVVRPHCEFEDQMQCSAFDVADPSTLITSPLKTGDTLDFDIVLWNPTQEKIGNVRMWLSYDAEALEGTVISITPSLPAVVPGQSDFSPLSGYAKIAANAEAGSEPTEAILPIARVTFTVKNAANGVSTPVSFYDQRAGIEGHTFVSTAAAPTQNLLTTPLGALLVQMIPSGPPAQGSSAPTSSTSASNASAETSASISSASLASSASSTATPSTSTSSGSTSATFSLIQVQNIRISTKENNLYVTWDALSHPKLQGYNVYFGTLRGRYLNRRSVSVASRGSVIRDLPVGKTYYVAVRGVDDKNQETAFSTEASVEIGNPSTSSAPIVGSLDLVSEVAPSTLSPENPVKDLGMTIDGAVRGVEVPGKSGAPSGVVLLLLASAAIGTLLACRRQAIASRTLPV